MVANFLADTLGRDISAADGRGNGHGSALGLSSPELTIVLEESHRSVPVALSSRWKKPLARVIALEDPLAELVPLLESSRSDAVIFAALSCVCILDTAALLASAAAVAGRIIKISASRTPIEMYAASRHTMVSLLRSALDRRTDRKPLRNCLFIETLLPSMDLLEEVSGDILFQNDLMDYFHNNLWVIRNCAGDSYHRILSRFPELSDKGAESHIAENGCVRNSWLASGVDVEGEIEDSIVFPNVHIGKNTKISRSVVLNGNRIGVGGEIQNSLVLPFSAEIPRNAVTIGDNCSIGSRSSTMKNTEFPSQIRDGLTVIGMNAELPPGLRIEAGVCICAGVPSSQLKKLKLIKKGTSIFRQNDSEARPANGVRKARR
jgi:UDP-3-O-[3-hydroxymyristoyl] glucosamine N-acyltransferase